MNDTPTPRTDFAIKASVGQWSYVLKLCSEELERELTAVTEQRDRLAEAIRKHKFAFPFAPDFCDVELYENLAAVEGGSEKPVNLIHNGVGIADMYSREEFENAMKRTN